MALAASAVATTLAAPCLPASAASVTPSVQVLVTSRAEVQRLLGALPVDEAGDNGYRARVTLDGAAPAGWGDDALDRVHVEAALVTGGPAAGGGVATPSLDLTWTVRECDTTGECGAPREVVSVTDPVAALASLDLIVRPARLRVKGTVPASLLKTDGDLPQDLAEGAQVDLDLPLPKALRAKTSAVVTGDVVLTSSDDGSSLTWAASRSADLDLPERAERVASLWPDVATATVTRAWAGSAARPLALTDLTTAEALDLVGSMRFDNAKVSGKVELSTSSTAVTDTGAVVPGAVHRALVGVGLESTGTDWAPSAAFRSRLSNTECAETGCANAGGGGEGPGVAPVTSVDGDTVSFAVGTATDAGTVTSTLDVALGAIVKPVLTISAVRTSDGGWRWTRHLALLAPDATYTGTIGGAAADADVVAPLILTADVDSWRTVTRDGPEVPDAS